MSKKKTAIKKKNVVGKSTAKKKTSSKKVVSSKKKTIAKKKAVKKEKAPTKKKTASKKKAISIKSKTITKTKTAVKKKAATAKKEAIKTKASKTKASKTKVSKKKISKKKIAKKVNKATKEAMLNARTRKSTPAIFKIKAKNTPIVFTLNDVKDIIRQKKKAPTNAENTSEEDLIKEMPKKKAPVVIKVKKTKTSKHAAASIVDILGFNPERKKSHKSTVIDKDTIPKKWLTHYKSLISIKNNVINGLNMHTKETLHHSSKEDSSDFSGYNQHISNSETENVDHDFVLSLVSSEQEALNEIEEAIQRIANGSYGICEITSKPIKSERLMAVPFTRHSLEGQRQLESNRKFSVQDRSNPFADIHGDETIKISDPDDS